MSSPSSSSSSTGQRTGQGLVVLTTNNNTAPGGYTEEGKTPDDFLQTSTKTMKSNKEKDESESAGMYDSDKALFNSPLTMFSRLLQSKSMESLQEQGANSELKRALRGVDLIAIGIGHLIGTGIFVLTGTAAADYAGPAVVVSFILAGITALLAAFCYAELAGIIPVSGSAYTYTYATMGEFIGWTIGWDLILEYMIGAATVSVGWSAYLVSFLEIFGLHLNKKWCQAPVEFDHITETFYRTGAYINLPAAVIVLAATAVLCFGIQESTTVNSIIVVLKVSVILIFIFCMGANVEPDNWEPFIPENQGKYGVFGWSGVFQGAAVVFFSYIGFDSVSTLAQECKNPGVDMPVGIIGSLCICTIFYILVALVITGVVKYDELSVADPIAYAVSQVSAANNGRFDWLEGLVSFGALAGLTSVILVSLMGQPRIFFAMAVDGLFPKWATIVHHKFKTPVATTLISGFICAICGAFLPLGVLSELTSVGTLFAFILVTLGVMVLRLKRPDIPRKFKVPLGPYVIPLAGCLASMGLVASCKPSTLYRLIAWMGLGWIVYFVYGYHRSKLYLARKAYLADREQIHQQEVGEGQNVSITEVELITTKNA